MEKYKINVFYLATLCLFSSFMYWIIKAGEQLEKSKKLTNPALYYDHWSGFINSLKHNLQHPLALLLAQILVIIWLSRIIGWVATKIGQPKVVGEMTAGIVLGPSLIGSQFPAFSAALFPVESLSNLQFLSQIGLIFFMFIVGMDLDLRVLKKKANDAVIISHASIVIPFTLGMGLAYLIYESFAPEDIHFLSFGLFIGIATSITAFPVLARIVQERGIHKTKLGSIVITCAAADDITAWCLLAAVIALVKAGSLLNAVYMIVLAAAYVILMIKVVKPLILNAVNKAENQIVPLCFFMMIASAYVTEIIGIHALFGAFMAGAIMPSNHIIKTRFKEKVEDVALVLLLPLFFAYTGLRTEIGLLNSLYLWKVTGLIIIIAVTGKMAGSALAAKFVGNNWKDSLTIGALMNTRGLMELVVLNIGYDLGVLSAEIFAMMVIMALVTTLMTGPVLDLINRLFKNREDGSVLY